MKITAKERDVLAALAVRGSVNVVTRDVVAREVGNTDAGTGQTLSSLARKGLVSKERWRGRVYYAITSRGRLAVEYR